jgi:hypothetical protein
MKKIDPSEILPIVEYERVRDEMRRAIIEHKKNRRIDVGPQVTFVFEDRKTTLFQIQEILRVEHIEDPDAVAAELKVYNDILPGEGELSATVMIAFSRTGAIREERAQLVGLMEGVRLELGDRNVRAGYEEGRETDDRISAVQYVRFRFEPDDIAALRDAERAALVIDHPAYRHQAEIWPEMRASLLEDLRAG